MQENNKHLWDQFCRLGEMMGDGLHHESDGKWISREYKRLSIILIPEIREVENERKVAKNKVQDRRIGELLEKFSCSCGGKCKQLRSGSLTVQCQCGKRYKAQKAKSAPQNTSEAVENCA
jgi:hypothetical protein